MSDNYQAIVNDFINTDLSVADFLRDQKYKGDAFADVLIQLNLISLLSEKNVLESITSEAERIDCLDFNPLAKAIFYMSWINASIHLNLKDQALLIREKAMRILPRNSPPIFFSTFETMDAFLKYGKKGLSEKMIEEYEKYKNTSIRYKRNLNLFLNQQCSRGMAYSINNEENYLKKYRKEFSDDELVYYTYQNDVVICNFIGVQKYFQKVENQSFLGLTHFIYYFLAKGEIRTNCLKEKTYVTEQLIHIANINLLLMKKEVNKANAELKKEYCESLWMLEVYFIHYTQIRLELINKNIEAAFQLLKNKINLGFDHYFDNFFLARLELLKGNQEKANLYFKKFYVEMEKHNASNLLKLELNLAYEMKPSDVFEFAKIMNSNDSKIVNVENIENIQEKIGLNKIEGVSEEIQKIKSNVKHFCNAEMPILILGETGVGKDVVARAIHEESARNKQPFIAINCGAIAESLLQSELFGHMEGSYTGATKTHKGIFQEAGKGTVFLDEIGDISPAIQIALLRVLENKEVRPIGSSSTLKFQCQIIAATNSNLENLVSQKLFREDLYYRLNRLTISIPPLRERKADIVPLAAYFLKSCRNNFETPILSEDLKEALSNFSWPGNIRQLKNEILQMDLMHSRKVFYELKDCNFLGTSINKQEAKPISTNVPTSKNNVSNLKKSSHRHRLIAIKKLFQDHSELTRSQIAETLQISLPTVTSDLKALANEKFISKIEPSKSPRSHYFILNLEKK